MGWGGSDPPGVVGGKGLVPEDEGSFAHVVVVPEGLAVLVYALLHAVLEVVALLVAF